LPAALALSGCAFLRDELGLSFDPFAEESPPAVCEAMTRSCEAYRRNAAIAGKRADALETQRQECEAYREACANSGRARR
jgi:hypothetical protein